MWTPRRGYEIATLNRMSHQRRMFVYRWAEMLSPLARPPFRLRPISRDLLRAELASVALSDSGKRRLSGSTLYAELLDEEWAQTQQQDFLPVTEPDVEVDPIGECERLVNELSLAGFAPETLTGAVQRVWLSSAAFGAQLDDVRQWHQERMGERTFRLVLPLVQKGWLQPEYGWQLVPYAELEVELRDAIDSAVERGQGSRAERYLSVRVMAKDPHAAVMIFLEQYDRYRLRIRPPGKPVGIATDQIVIHDSYPEPLGRVVRFPLPAHYAYPRPALPTSAEMMRHMAAARFDPVIDIVLDQYMYALQAISRESLRDAFQALVPLLDVGFDCADGPWAERTAFARTIEISAMFTAVLLPHVLFEHIRDYLRRPCKLNDNRNGVQFMRGKDDHQDFGMLTGDRWPQVAQAYQWNPLVAHRRRELMRLTHNETLPQLRRAQQVARWDMARAVRARHAFAHRGEPLTDSYVLAVVLEVARLCLIARTVAAERGIKFGDLVARLEQVLAGQGDMPQWVRLAAHGEWQLIDAIYPGQRQIQQ